MQGLSAAEIRKRLVSRMELPARYLRPGERAQLPGGNEIERPYSEQDPEEISDINRFETDQESKDILSRVMSQRAGRSPQGAFDPGASEVEQEKQKVNFNYKVVPQGRPVAGTAVLDKKGGGIGGVREINYASPLDVSAPPPKPKPQAPQAPMQYGDPVGPDVIYKAIKMMREPAVAQETQENPQDEGDLMSLALLAALPTVVGGLFGGAGGFAAGGQIGANAVGKEVGRREGVAKERRESLAKQQEARLKLEQEREMVGIKGAQQLEIEKAKAEALKGKDVDVIRARGEEDRKTLGIKESGLGSRLDKVLSSKEELEKLKESGLTSRQGKELSSKESLAKLNLDAQKITRNAKRADDIYKARENDPRTKRTKEISENYQKMLNLVAQAERDPKLAGAADIGIVFTYMKTLDPTSTVREGEYATARNAAGVPESLRTAWNRMVAGEQLGPEQRKSILDASRVMVESQKSIQDKFDSEILRSAQSRGIEMPEGGFVDVMPTKSTAGQDDELSAIRAERQKMAGRIEELRRKQGK